MDCATHLNWAVIGTGWIANDMAAAMKKEGMKPYAVCSRKYENALAYAEKYGVEKAYRTIDEVMEDEQVDIVYLATPHNKHADIAENALKHGKHVLAEKAIVLNSRELDSLIALAEEKKLVLAEAMTTYHMPVYKKLRELLDEGSLGKVQLMSVNFGSYKPYDMTNRFFSPETAGGAMLDIGVYALSAVRFFMDGKPEEILTQWKPSPAGTDEMGTILLRNAAGQLATVSIAMHSKLPKKAIISCENAYIELTEYPRAERAVIVDAATGAQTVIEDGKQADALWYEVLDMEEAIRTGNTDKMHLNYSKDVMDVMTFCRKQWGMQYPGEIW